jgi:hypothetical protein
MNDIKRKWTKVGTAMPFVKSLMKMQLVTATLLIEIEAKIPRVLRPAPFAKGGQWGISQRCSNHGTSFSCACCTDWYMNYFASFATGNEDLRRTWTENLSGAGESHERRYRRAQLFPV